MSSGCGDVLSLEDLKTAKKHQLFEAEVITGRSGGVSGGASIDYATNAVTGQVQKTMPAILRDIGFRPAPFDFDTGGTIGINDRDLAVLWPAPGGDNDWYYWEGALPKVIPASSTPLTTGGIADGAWRPVGDITLRGSLAASTGATLVGYGGGTVAKALNNLYARTDYVTPEEFGAVGDGVTDDTAAFQLALDAITAAGRGLLYVPRGPYVISAKLNITTNTVVEGAGIGATQILYTGANTGLFEIGTGSNNPNNCFIRNLHIVVNTTQTANALVRIRNGYNCGLQYIRIDGPYYDGVMLVGGAQQFIYKVEDCVINGTSASNNTITIGDATALVQDVFLTNLVLGGDINSCGVLEQYASGVYASNVDSLGGKYGYAWIPLSGCYCKGSFYTNVLGDTNKEHGLVFDPPAGTFISDLNLTACWGSSAGTTASHSGLYIDGSKGTVANVNFNGITCVNNKGSGIEVLGSNAYGINISNVDTSNNSQAGSALAHGIALGSGVSRVNISNGHSGATQNLGSNLQGYGVIINAGAGQSINVTNMDLQGNVTGPLSNGATGDRVYIAGCGTYKTANRGSAQLSSGSSTVTVTPGLSSAFTAVDVQVTPTTDTAGARWWVTQSGSSFTININTAAAANLFFSWSVDTQQAHT